MGINQWYCPLDAKTNQNGILSIWREDRIKIVMIYDETKQGKNTIGKNILSSPSDGPKTLKNALLDNIFILDGFFTITGTR